MNVHVKPPAQRRLQVFSIDPSLDNRLDTFGINRTTIKVPWEANLEPGPVGEYLEVIDLDPASQCFYPPVDLDDRFLLAQDGLEPSDGNPQFHQQMVYAVAMRTIRNFERALGRKILSHAELGENAQRKYKPMPLRIYPHALRIPNAYYSPQRHAIMFGYFPAMADPRGQAMQGAMIFSCLSHDVIAHETTHAILHGINRLYIEPANRDALAFHEAFADIVALFQHFTMPDVLLHQIAKTRGSLEKQNLLAELAHELGQATGHYGALRSAIGEMDENGRWRSHEADPRALAQTQEPHERGAILVAAVFDAFLQIYKNRIADLLRIATGGTGVLSQGELHPDLVRRLANEAAKAAGHVLKICIRALDYCPPVDLNFGEYLRALITADYDLMPDDERGYRVAFIDAFRKRGIFPEDVKSLSEESLLWRSFEKKNLDKLIIDAMEGAAHLKSDRNFNALAEAWSKSIHREDLLKFTKKAQSKIHTTLQAAMARNPELQEILGLCISGQKVVESLRIKGKVCFMVDGVRPARRIGDGNYMHTDLVIELIQRRRGYLNPEVQKQVDQGALMPEPEPDFICRGGCTILVNMESRKVRYCIRKSILSEERLARYREMQERLQGDLRATYFSRRSDPEDSTSRILSPIDTDPFRFIHFV